MSKFNTETLLQEISAESPCGEDLEYDAAFGELERAAQGKAEQQIGDTIVDAEEPDWKDVQKLALELFSRTKDVRITLYLTQASLHIDGFLGLRDGLLLLRDLLQQYWGSIYPELDVEDNNDPTMRINALVPLCDDQVMLNPVRKAPLVSSRMMGNFSLRHIAIAKGEIQTKDASDHTDMTSINAAFMDAEIDQLQATAQAIEQALDYLTEIESFVTDQVGAANAASLNDLSLVLKDAQIVLTEQLSQRGLDVGGNDDSEQNAQQAGAVRTAPALSGTINSRDDVIKALDKIRDYYLNNEPSSPLPLLMDRAKKLVKMDFMEIIQNLAPDGISQVETIRGPEE